MSLWCLWENFCTDKFSEDTFKRTFMTARNGMKRELPFSWLFFCCLCSENWILIGVSEPNLIFIDIELFMGSISTDNLFYGMSDFNYRNSKMLHLNIQSLKLEFGLFLSRHFGKLLPIVFSHCCAINVPCSLFFFAFLRWIFIFFSTITFNCIRYITPRLLYLFLNTCFYALKKSVVLT